MSIPEGLRTSLNSIRETSIQNNTLYHKYVPEILPTSDIGSFASPILSNPNVMNEFMNVLVQRIVYTQVDIKLFNNPLRILEGDRIPLGSIGQEIFINPAKGRKFNVNDFAGLLAKYEADVKVQYHHLNSDLQYCLTITRAKLKDAFVSWGTLENFIEGLTQSLYNGAYIDQYNLTKGLVSSAYASNQVQIELISDITTADLAKEFITKARIAYLNMQTPSFKYNAWRKVGGYGRDILTWSNPEDLVFLVRNDIGAYLDVNVLAQTFNIDESVLLGNIIYVNDFNEYDSEGKLIFDGSKIVGMLADKSWFRIKEQETTMDEFYNANNRTWQYYLNVVRMYSYSLFSNALVFATGEPDVPVQKLDFGVASIDLDGAGTEKNLEITVTPAQATTEVTFEISSGKTYASCEKIDNRNVKVTALGTGTATLKATAGNVSTTLTINVTTG